MSTALNTLHCTVYTSNKWNPMYMYIPPKPCTFCHVMDQHDKVCLCVLMPLGKWWKRGKLPNFFRDGWPSIYKTAHSVMIDFCCLVYETSLRLVLRVRFRRHRPNILVPLSGQVVDLSPPLFHFLLIAHT